ncbi:MAG: sulfatase [Planctomycetes bacterium]|nr:sulfatase [Planctomycetota bacterium]
MTRLRPLLLLPLLAAALLPACGDGAADDDAGELVLVVLIDTLRRDALSCYGGPPGVTPNLDALAADGARFEAAISSSGWTLPSVASLLTGTWPTLHRATGKGTRLTPVTPDLRLAAEVFHDAGWDTLAFVNAAFLSPMLGLGRGFDVYDHRHAYNDVIRRADETVDAALAALAERRGRDVFALVHLFDPHLDYDPPAAWRARWAPDPVGLPPRLDMRTCVELGTRRAEGVPTDAERAYVRGLYEGEVAFVDSAFGRLVSGLRQLGRWDRARVVVVADHGEEFWDHGGFEHGHTLYDELVRVPLLVKGCAGARGVVVEQQVRTIDVLPTLFAEVGVAAPPSFEGRSLAPLLRGEDVQELPAFSQSTLYGRNKLSWRREGFQLVYDLDPDAEQQVELFDLGADPLGRTEVSAQRSDVAHRLQRELGAFYGQLKQRAKSVRTPEWQDMSPTHVHELLESLESLGYVGREGDAPDDAAGER